MENKEQINMLKEYNKDELISMLLELKKRLEEDRLPKENIVSVGDFTIKSSTCSLKNCIDKMHKLIERHYEFEKTRKFLKPTSYIG